MKKDGLQWGGRSLNRTDFARAEFWIVPKDAEMPDIRANECGLIVCPTLEIKGEQTIKDLNNLKIFAASVSGGSGEAIEYHWTVSAGSIVEGQGTPVVKVDLKSVEDKEVQLTIELDGISDLCAAHQETLLIKIQ